MLGRGELGVTVRSAGNRKRALVLGRRQDVRKRSAGTRKRSSGARRRGAGARKCSSGGSVLSVRSKRPDVGREVLVPREWTAG